MKIGIVVAMEKELEPFLRNKTYVTKRDGNYVVYCFEMGGKEIFAVLPMNVGEICAASAVQLLVSAYGAEVIVNFGVVGSLTKKVSLLAEVLVSSVVHYAMDVSALDGRKVGKYKIFDDVAIATDSVLLQKASALRPELPLVRCASADKFVASPEEKEELNLQFGADICDMESAGIVISCKLNNVPCLLFKVISDSLTGGAGEFTDYVLAASEKFADFVDEFLERL